MKSRTPYKTKKVVIIKQIINNKNRKHDIGVRVLFRTG